MDGGEKAEEHGKKHESSSALAKSNDNTASEGDGPSSGPLQTQNSIDILSKSHADISERVKSTSCLEGTTYVIDSYVPVEDRVTNRVSFAEESNLVKVFKVYENKDINNERVHGSKTSHSEMNTSVTKSYYWKSSSASQKSIIELGGPNVCSKKSYNTHVGELLQSTLANYLWTFPKVEQRIAAYPMTTTKKISTLAHARNKSEHLKQELEKEPIKHKLSAEDPKIEGYKPAGKRKESKAQGQGNQAQGLHHEGSHHKRKPLILDTGRSLAKPPSKTHEMGGRGESVTKLKRKSPAVHAGLPKRNSHGSLTGSIHSMKSVADPEQTHSILLHLREQNEDLENKSISAKLSRIRKKCCAPCIKCVSSRKFTYCAFFTIIVIVTIGCICAIVFPIVRMYIDF